MTVNPIGPLTPEEWQEAIDAPFGGAAAILKKHDPMWGLGKPDGEKVKWRVRLRQNVTMEAVTYVDAADEEEAEALAERIDASTLTFSEFIDADDGEIYDVEPA